VEDEGDIRRLLVTALELEGHIVAEATNAREGLKCLQDARFDLVLSDYAMPGETGAWMLEEATRLGLLKDTVALVVTATPDIHELKNVEIVTKPLDLDAFLDLVRRTVAERTGSERLNEPEAGAENGAQGAQGRLRRKEAAEGL
jgi:DNA-binding NtrC family response regulator